MHKTVSQTPGIRESLALATFLGATQAPAQTTATPPPASGQNPGSNEVLPEVTVSAARERAYNPENVSSPKITAPLLDTPQTFSVIPKEVFNQQGARNLTDVLKNTPGISFNAGENGFSSGLGNFSMRGMDTSGSIFMDGVRDSGSFLRDVFNLENVEIAKGPAADNGRGTAGGYVNLVTKTPGLENFYSGSASYSLDEYGTNGNLRTTFDINQVLGESPLEGTAFRLNALFQEGGVAGRRWAEANSWGIAPSLSIGLGTPSRFTLAYQHVTQNNVPDWGVPTGYPNSGAPLTSGQSGYLSDPNRGRRDVFYGLRSDYDDIQSDTLLATFEQDFANGLKLTNQTRLSRTDQDSRYTVPRNLVWDDRGATTATAAEGYNRVNESISNQTNLIYEFATGSLKHTLSAGLELSRETSEADKLNPVTLAAVPTGNPNPDRVPGPTLQKLGYNDITIESIAAYIYDTVEFSPQWELTGGVRVEHYSADVKRVVTNAAGVVDPTQSASFKTSDTTVSGKLGIVYKPQENGSIYASAGIAALPPGSFLSNPDISRTGDSNDFPNYKSGAKTQQSINVEFGTKWEFFNSRLSTSAALFYTQKQNAIVDTPLSPYGANSWEYSDQEIYGLELGVAGQVTDDWSVFAGVLLMDSKRKNNSNVDRYRQASDGGSVDGDELAYTPNFTANLWTTYKLPAGFTVGGGLQYVGSSYIGRPDDAGRVIPNDQYGGNSKLPDYIVFNALLQYDITENISVRLNVDNVFDEVYAVSTNWGGTRALLGPPRTYTISADWKF